MNTPKISRSGPLAPFAASFNTALRHIATDKLTRGKEHLRKSVNYVLNASSDFIFTKTIHNDNIII